MPEEEEPLQQGDLLGDLAFPRLTGELKPVGQQLVLGVDMRPAVVVSQSCTIENQGVVAVAPLRMVAVKDKGYEQILRNAGPGRGPDNPDANRFVFHMFALDPHPHLLAEPAGQIRVVDLCQIVTMGGHHAWLQELRLGRMTAQGRRALRYNLATFWGRTTEQDAIELTAAGQQLTLGG
jgi:hypothetical protein